MVTTTGYVPAARRSVVLKVIFSSLALTSVVVCGTALKLTVDVVTKFVPVIVSVSAAAPSVAELGERLVIVGTGLFTVKLTGIEAPPPGAGLLTTTALIPAVA